MYFTLYKLSYINKVTSHKQTRTARVKAHSQFYVITYIAFPLLAEMLNHTETKIKLLLLLLLLRYLR